MVQDRHILHGQLELALAPSKTPSKLQRQEHPGLLLGVLDAADRKAVLRCECAHERTLGVVLRIERRGVFITSLGPPIAPKTRLVIVDC